MEKFKTQLPKDEWKVVGVWTRLKQTIQDHRRNMWMDTNDTETQKPWSNERSAEAVKRKDA